MRALLALVASLAFGCTVEPLDLGGRSCPCVDGWVCDEARDVCVEAAIPTDAGMDAARPDAGGVDAGPRDAATSDAGPTDAGPMDAAVPDAGFDAGPPMDAGSDAGPPAPPSLCGSTHVMREFCDGFDTGDLSAWSSSNTDVGGTITAVTSPVYRGSHAMRFECPRGCGYAAVDVSPFGMVPQPTDIWVRGYYYWRSANPPGMEHVQIGDDAFVQAAVASVWSTSTVNWHAHDYLGDYYNDTMYTVSLDRWVCVEMHLSTSAMGGGAEIFWDGTRVDGNLGLDGTPAPMTRIDTVITGIAYKDIDDVTQVVYVDEVVVSTSRIGCDI